MNAATSSEETYAKLRAALQYSTGDPVADNLMRDSIRAGIVGDSAVLQHIYEQEVGPEQAEVDLHLDGPGVQGHSTNAKQFSDFVSGISDAVKFTAKQLSGSEKYSQELLIEGATPGSVRLVLKAPPRLPHSDQIVDERTSASSTDSDALRVIASILTHASDPNPNPDSPLIAEVAAIPPKARSGLLRAIRTSKAAGWTIEGSVRQRKIGLQTVELSSLGADRLSIELKTRVQKETYETVVGKIDGFRRSLGALYIAPEDRPIVKASVIDPTLEMKVHSLSSQPELKVKVKFKVVESYLPGDVKQFRVTRTLESIEPAPSNEQD